MSARRKNPPTENDDRGQGPTNSGPTALLMVTELVQRFKVCWEAHPEEEVVVCEDRKLGGLRKEIRRIGFSLELYGTFPAGYEPEMSPGCNDFQKIQSALKKIADWILPREKRPCIFHVDVDAQSVTHSHRRADRPDVRVIIRILHRNNGTNRLTICKSGASGIWRRHSTHSVRVRGRGVQFQMNQPYMLSR